MLYHISEQPDIQRFEPRAPEFTDECVVWAISADSIQNYLLPRDCPRVTFYANDSSTTRDIEQFLGASVSVVAVESTWLERIQASRLYCYSFDVSGFKCIDEVAGYYVNSETVMPKECEVINDPIARLGQMHVELRIVSSLWPLRDAVLESSLSFSFIRMRNSAPR